MTAYSLSGAGAIVGVGTSGLGRAPGETVLSLQMQAARKALSEAGLRLQDVNGLMVSGYPYVERQAVLVGEYLGIRPRYVDSTNVGGAGFIAGLERAVAAIQTGLAEIVLVTYGSTQYSSRLRGLAGRAPEFTYQYEVPHGLPQPLGGYALAAARHMHEYGTTSEQLAEVAVAARMWATLNPEAVRREPLSASEVLASPMIATPLHQLDCCLVTDGGGAVVVTSASHARDLRQKPVLILGSGYAQTHEAISTMPDLCRTAAVESGALALSRARVTLADIDVFEIYDSFTITVLLSLEDLGFCEKGMAGPFISDGRTRPGGRVPLNTSGGGLSYCHPGMFGIFLLIEAVRQLRGECGERQVGEPRLALCHGTGGQLSTAATAILGVD